MRGSPFCWFLLLLRKVLLKFLLSFLTELGRPRPEPGQSPTEPGQSPDRARGCAPTYFIEPEISKRDSLWRLSLNVGAL